MDRGIEVLKLRSRGTHSRYASRAASVTAPDAGRDRFAPRPARSLERGAMICPTFERG